MRSTLLLLGAVVFAAAAGCSKSKPEGEATGSASAAASAAATSTAAASAAASADEEALGPCKRENFETKLVKEACEKGGQKEAKRAMNEFMKANVKPKNPEAKCKICHENMAPDFETKEDALKQFKEFGGE